MRLEKRKGKTDLHGGVYGIVYFDGGWLHGEHEDDLELCAGTRLGWTRAVGAQSVGEYHVVIRVVISRTGISSAFAWNDNHCWVSPCGPSYTLSEQSVAFSSPAFVLTTMQDVVVRSPSVSDLTDSHVETIYSTISVRLSSIVSVLPLIAILDTDAPLTFEAVRRVPHSSTPSHPPTAHGPRSYLHTCPAPRGKVQRHPACRKQIRRICLSPKQGLLHPRREQPHRWPSLRNPRRPLRTPCHSHPPRQWQQPPRSRLHPHHLLASLVRRGAPRPPTRQTVARRRPRGQRRKRDRNGHHLKGSPLHKKFPLSTSHTCNLDVCASLSTPPPHLTVLPVESVSTSPRAAMPSSQTYAISYIFLLP